MKTNGTERVAHYLDTSALVKLAVHEAESAALFAWAKGYGGDALVTSDIARTELMRALRRSAPDAAQRGRIVLESVTLIGLSPQILDAAGRLEPVTLRSLDAIHLSSALALGDDLESLVTYDERLADATRAYGIPVTAPA